MKNISFLLFALFACVFSSCNDKGPDTLNTETPVFSIPGESLVVNFGNTKGVAHFTVTTNRKFKAVVDPSASWCSATVIPYANRSNVEVVVPGNPDAGRRTAKITVSSEGFQPIDVTVTQLGQAPEILVKEKEVTITKEELSFTLEVTSNIEVAFDLPEWIDRVERTRASETNIYNFTADAIPENDFRRNGTITVRAADPEDEQTPGELSVEIPVVQYGNEPFITARETLVTVIGGDFDFSITVASNVEIEFTLPEWIEQTAAPSGGTYYFRAGALPQGANSRQDEISVKPKDPETGAVPLKITVRQIGDPSLEAPRFAVISDIHHGRSGSAAKVSQAIASLMSIEPAIEAIFVVGDITDYGNATQYDELLTVWADTRTQLPVYFMMGNHDHYTVGGGAEAMYKSKMGTDQLHQYIEMKGHGFICVSQRGTAATNYYTEEIDFIRNNIAKANTDFPGRPVFVFTHLGVTNTCYGTDAGWGTNAYSSALTGHPEVILFSGHSHFPLGDPRSIHQGSFTAVNDGGTAYAEIESGVCSEGIHPANNEDVTEAVIVTVQPNGDVELTRWDTYRNEEILPKWLVEAPHDGSRFKYTTAARKTLEAPVFAPGAEAAVTNIGDFTCTVNFPAAGDDQNVFLYDVRIYETGAANAVKTYTKFSGFYLNGAAPADFSLNFDGLTLGTGYRVEITAVDSFLNRSAALTATFTTTDSRPQPVTDAPVADMLDAVFNDKGIYDRSPAGRVFTQGFAAPTTSFVATHNSYMATFAGSQGSYYKYDYQNDSQFKATLDADFTFEAYFVSNYSGGGYHSPVSSQETGGFGFEITGGWRPDFYYRSGTIGAGTGSYVVTEGSGTIVKGNYTHMAVTCKVNADGSKTFILYVDGTQSATKTTGAGHGFKPAVASAQWLCVGGDAHTSENCQAAMPGNIAFTRFYGRVLDAGDISKLYQQIEYRKYVFNAADLAALLTITLPAKAAANPSQTGQINEIIAKGWGVMNNYASTESDFAAMIAECNTY